MSRLLTTGHVMQSVVLLQREQKIRPYKRFKFVVLHRLIHRFAHVLRIAYSVKALRVLKWPVFQVVSLCLSGSTSAKTLNYRYRGGQGDVFIGNSQENRAAFREADRPTLEDAPNKARPNLVPINSEVLIPELPHLALHYFAGRFVVRFDKFFPAFTNAGLWEFSNLPFNKSGKNFRVNPGEIGMIHKSLRELWQEKFNILNRDVVIVRPHIRLKILVGYWQFFQFFICVFTQFRCLHLVAQLDDIGQQCTRQFMRRVVKTLEIVICTWCDTKQEVAA